MIDIRTETLYTLREAAQLCPPRRNGRRPVGSCHYRWAKTSLHGVRLEVLKVGTTTTTSPESLQRFFSELTRVAGLEAGARTASPAENAAAIERQLDAFDV